MILATNVARVQRQYGLSNHQLSKITGLHHSTISRIREARRTGESSYNPSLSTLKKLSKAFDVEGVDTLLFDKLEAAAEAGSTQTV
jgi:transcriptional regulator with XRE-family HTH domain